MSKRFIIHDLGTQDIIKKEEQTQKNLLIFDARPKVNHCIGCFGCWVKTPGRCVINDRSTITPAMAASAKEMIIISRLLYGGYSPEVKAVLDRSIGYIMPYFRMINGEMHHTMRYDNPFKLSVHFYGQNITDEECRLAEKLVAANALNLGAGGQQVYFHDKIDSLEEVL